MTAYVANHEKKRRIFAKREREMRHAIKHVAPVEKLRITAEKLRAAKIGVFKCRFTMNSENQPYNFSPQNAALHDEEICLWTSMSADEIVEMYRSCAPPA